MDWPSSLVKMTLIQIVTVVLFWPPVAKYNVWEALSRTALGDTPTLALAVGTLLAVAAGVGHWLQTETPVTVAGAFLAYLVVVGFVEVFITTDSPVHFIAYAIMFAILSAGLTAGSAVASA